MKTQNYWFPAILIIVGLFLMIVAINRTQQSSEVIKIKNLSDLQGQFIIAKIEGYKVIVLELGASFCQACKWFNGHAESLGREYSGDVLFLEAQNIYKNEGDSLRKFLEAKCHFRANALPTILYFKQTSGKFTLYDIEFGATKSRFPYEKKLFFKTGFSFMLYFWGGLFSIAIGVASIAIKKFLQHVAARIISMPG